MTDIVSRPRDCSLCRQFSDKIVWYGTFVCERCKKMLEDLKQK